MIPLKNPSFLPWAYTSGVYSPPDPRQWAQLWQLKATPTGPYRPPESVVPTAVPGAWVGHGLWAAAFQARARKLSVGQKARSG